MASLPRSLGRAMTPGRAQDEHIYKSVANGAFFHVSLCAFGLRTNTPAPGQSHCFDHGCGVYAAIRPPTRLLFSPLGQYAPWCVIVSCRDPCRADFHAPEMSLAACRISFGMISSVRKSRLAPIHLADMSPPALCLRRSGIPETRGPLPWKQAPHAAATSELLTCRSVPLNVADVSRSPVSGEFRDPREASCISLETCSPQRSHNLLTG